MFKIFSNFLDRIREHSNNYHIVQEFNKNNRYKIKFSLYYDVILNPPNRNYPLNVGFYIRFPEYVFNFLRTIQTPNQCCFKRISLHSPHQIIPFTRGIELSDSSLDFISRCAIKTILEHDDLCHHRYDIHGIRELGIIFDGLIIKFLMKPELHTPSKVIRVLRRFSKNAQFTERHLFIFSKPDTCIGWPFNEYEYTKLDEHNPAKIFLEEMQETY
ncbi:hypothetical protein TVAG_119140 [Trichomonas vaginalis G3]|uniref:Uncharacterized protein n=1 Tax=Trichomonas vaginalis (strain ATCC PRA-98 / G3) TaxID=412133 RepID=A2D761_TRIV3|nr:hypothetical protein TVAGG3_0991830 [Trichomonas vaginalis G3]EAY23578.1 hypothetical protein TVAG_119140 [Trichomonas vaginalis G3]KAI5490075.1 hypothetical protein TVAGG3_0991830 [Trichomonas vaginalis G3]|eukprot:XP_001276826.1 hypothetical protein [Trichomonas vaginalis G3]